MPREAHNSPLHLFSASPGLVGFGQSAYQRRSETTSRVLGQLFERLRGEGVVMAFTMEDFNRGLVKVYFPKLSPEEQQEVLKSFPPDLRRELVDSLPPEERLAGLSPEQIRKYLDQLSAGGPPKASKRRRKK